PLARRGTRQTAKHGDLVSPPQICQAMPAALITDLLCGEEIINVSRAPAVPAPALQARGGPVHLSERVGEPAHDRRAQLRELRPRALARSRAARAGVRVRGLPAHQG